MADRRTFLAGMIASALIPKPSWADVGMPAFLSAGKKPLGPYVLCGLSATGQILFETPLPSRGHAAAAHPDRPEAIAFARRPGTFAVVIDCRTGREKARLTPPAGRHFYGHGAFSADGALLFTTENDFDAARGMIGVWDAKTGYARVDEFASGGIGPHDIKRLPNEETLVIANGGIETHPDTGRTKLNIPMMRPNLTYAGFDGRLQDRIELDTAHRKNSIRHLAVARNGTVAFAMQWQGDLSEDRPLLGTHQRTNGAIRFAEAVTVRRMNGYLGSVAVSSDDTIAVTSPQRGQIQILRGTSLTLAQDITLEDVCGIASGGNSFVATSGLGRVQQLDARASPRQYDIAWDNHLIAV